MGRNPHAERDLFDEPLDAAQARKRLGRAEQLRLKASEARLKARDGEQNIVAVVGQCSLR